MEKIMEIVAALEKNYEEKKRKMYASYEDTEWGIGVINGYENAITDIKKMMAECYPPFYFTFGTDPAYPYGIEDYVVVHAASLSDAVHKFNQKHRKRPGSNATNCAFWYTEEEWNKSTKQYYGDRKPVEVIW